MAQKQLCNNKVKWQDSRGWPKSTGPWRLLLVCLVMCWNSISWVSFTYISCCFETASVTLVVVVGTQVIFEDESQGIRSTTLWKDATAYAIKRKWVKRTKWRSSCSHEGDLETPEIYLGEKSQVVPGQSRLNKIHLGLGDRYWYDW